MQQTLNLFLPDHLPKHEIAQPSDDPTHSPMVAPIGAYTAASLIPDNNEGIAAGIFK